MNCSGCACKDCTARGIGLDGLGCESFGCKSCEQDERSGFISKCYNKKCLTCSHYRICGANYGFIGVDEEDCTALLGTHFCMADWDMCCKNCKRKERVNSVTDIQGK